MNAPSGEDRPPAPRGVVPPPAPALDPRPDLRQTRLLLALFGVGLALVFAGLLPFPLALLCQRAGFFLATFAVLAAAAWLPASVLSRRIDAALDRWVRNTSGGFYGVMALAVFVQLELAGLPERLAGFDPGGALREALVARIVGFTTDSVMAFVWGMAWPARLIKDHGSTATVLLAAACWVVFRASRPVLPHAAFEKRPGAAAGTEGRPA
jgi:hypothetical protein